MASEKTKDVVGSFLAALFSDDDRVVVAVLRNNQNPERPAARAALAKAYVFVSFFAPTKEEARGLGPGVPWDESGTFMLNVFVCNGSGDVVCDEIYKAATRALRGRSIEDAVDIGSMFGDDGFGPRMNGDWFGRSVAVEFETQDI